MQNLERDAIKESADKPGSVLDSHLSRTFVAKSLKQPTRTVKAQGLRLCFHNGSYLVLLQVGFTKPQNVTTCAVRSYRTISPLPALRTKLRRYTFCCTGRGLTPPRRYLAPCPLEPGLSSSLARSDCLADSSVVYTNFPPYTCTG